MIEITTIYPTDDLYFKYPNQTTPQPTYIELRDGALFADVDTEIGGGVPSDVWHGSVRRWKLPSVYLTHEAICGLMDEIYPLVQRIWDDLSIDWDGSNWVGRLSDEGDSIEIELVDQIEKFSGEEIKVMAAGDYYALDSSEIDELIKSGASDEEISEFAIADASANGVDVLENLDEFLAYRKDEIEE